jgi:hypothetical protein
MKQGTIKTIGAAVIGIAVVGVAGGTASAAAPADVSGLTGPVTSRLNGQQLGNEVAKTLQGQRVQRVGDPGQGLLGGLPVHGVRSPDLVGDGLLR